MDTAGIVQVDFFLQPGSQVGKAKRRYAACRPAYYHGREGLVYYIAACSLDYSTCQCCVQNYFDIESIEGELGDKTSGNDGSGDGKQCINGSSLLLGSLTNGGVKGGPVHKEEESSNHGNVI